MPPGMATFIECRALREHEVEAWLDLCAEAFKAKGTPRAYFQAHWERDPCRQLDGVFVAVANDVSPRLVASVRVFHREIFLDLRPTKVGGIGEVCTLEEYRGQGLATRLLELATEYMAQMQMQLASLHANPQLAMLYERAGFVGVQRQYCIWRRDASELIEVADFMVGVPQPGEQFIVETLLPGEGAEARIPVPAVAQMHAAWAQRFNGCVVRSAEYWQSWARRELVGPERALTLVWHETPTGRALLAYMGTRARVAEGTPLLSVTEWAWQEGSAFGETECFVSALGDILKIRNERGVKVKWPAQIMHAMEESDPESIFEEGSYEICGEMDGFMYKSIGAHQIEPSSLHGNDSGASKHLFWGTDGF